MNKADQYYNQIPAELYTMGVAILILCAYLAWRHWECGRAISGECAECGVPFKNQIRGPRRTRAELETLWTESGERCGDCRRLRLGALIVAEEVFGGKWWNPLSYGAKRMEHVWTRDEAMARIRRNRRTYRSKR
jgi:hypothetical protein